MKPSIGVEEKRSLRLTETAGWTFPQDSSYVMITCLNHAGFTVRCYQTGLRISSYSKEIFQGIAGNIFPSNDCRFPMPRESTFRPSSPPRPACLSYACQSSAAAAALCGHRNGSGGSRVIGNYVPLRHGHPPSLRVRMHLPVFASLARPRSWRRSKSVSVAVVHG